MAAGLIHARTIMLGSNEEKSTGEAGQYYYGRATERLSFLLVAVIY